MTIPPADIVKELSDYEIDPKWIRRRQDHVPIPCWNGEVTRGLLQPGHKPLGPVSPRMGFRSLDPTPVVQKPRHRLNPLTMQLIRRVPESVWRWLRRIKPHHEHGPTEVALKVIMDVDPAELEQTVLRELFIWAALSHENIQSLIGYHLDIPAKKGLLVTEWEPRGNLRNFLQENPVSVRQALELLLDVASALDYLHSMDPAVIHGDIKPESVLVTQSGRAILWNFGLACVSGFTEYPFSESDDFPLSLRWASPELFQENPVRSPASDIWAWGWLAWEVATGNIPFHDVPQNGVILAIVRRNLPNEIGHRVLTKVAPQLWEVIKACWALEAGDRPSSKRVKGTLTQLLRHDKRDNRYGYDLVPHYSPQASRTEAGSPSFVPDGCSPRTTVSKSPPVTRGSPRLLTSRRGSLRGERPLTMQSSPVEMQPSEAPFANSRDGLSSGSRLLQSFSRFRGPVSRKSTTEFQQGPASRESTGSSHAPERSMTPQSRSTTKSSTSLQSNTALPESLPTALSEQSSSQVSRASTVRGHAPGDTAAAPGKDDAIKAAQPAVPSNGPQRESGEPLVDATNTPRTSGNSYLSPVTTGKPDYTALLENRELIARGGFCEVFKANTKDTETAVAVKVFRLDTVSETQSASQKERLLRMVQREIDVWESLDHPNILRLEGFAYLDGDRSKPSLVSMFYPQGNATHYLKENPSADRKLIIRNVIDAVKFLHEMVPGAIIHGDLKPANVLIRDDGSALLCDFGSTQQQAGNTARWEKSHQVARTIVYSAPENLQGEPLTLKSDIFSLGWLILELLTNKAPYYWALSLQALFTFIFTYTMPTHQHYPTIAEGSPVWKFLWHCLRTAPDERPDIRQVQRAIEDLDGALDDAVRAVRDQPPAERSPE